jgi:hypothetical protein
VPEFITARPERRAPSGVNFLDQCSTWNIPSPLVLLDKSARLDWLYPQAGEQVAIVLRSVAWFCTIAGELQVVAGSCRLLQLPERHCRFLQIPADH